VLNRRFAVDRTQFPMIAGSQETKHGWEYQKRKTCVHRSREAEELVGTFILLGAVPHTPSEYHGINPLGVGDMRVVSSGQQSVRPKKMVYLEDEVAGDERGGTSNVESSVVMVHEYSRQQQTGNICLGTTHVGRSRKTTGMVYVVHGTKCI